jgi:hypothetical protein
MYDQAVAKASTYTGQYNSETHVSSGIRNHDLSNQAALIYALDRAATGTGRNSFITRPKFFTFFMEPIILGQM